jgi:hypothetical protein
MRWWKVLGLAGVVGVAATGAVVARAERRRRSYAPDEIRDRLHARHAELEGEPAGHREFAAGKPSGSPDHE